MSKIKSIVAAFAVMLSFVSASVLTSCDKDVNVSSVQITPEGVTLGIGETQKLTVTIEPSDATDPTYSLESSDPSVAAVQNDVVTAVAPGEAVITATTADGSLKATCKVTVVKHVEDITVTPTQVKVTVGKTQEITVEFTPADASDQTVTWESSNPEVATVADGVVTGVAPGEALVTATSVDGGFAAACKVVVEEEFNGIVAIAAGGYYCGDQYATGYDNDYLFLLSGNVKEGGLSLAGKGTALWLDLNLPKTGATTLPAEHYIPLLSDDQEQSYTWLPGTEMGAWGIVGSFIYTYQEGDTEPQYIMAEQGTVDVTVDGSEYTINAVVTAGGKEYKFRYIGAVTLKDVKDAGDPPAQDYTEVDLGNELIQGYFEFDGDAYSTGGVSNNWLIYLADSRVDFTKQNLVGPGKILMLELNTAPSAGKELPAGTFNVLNPKEITSAASLAPFTVVPGLVNSEGGVYGTWYLATDTQGGDFQPLCGAQKGTVSVKKGGDSYTIDFDITDDDYKISVKGSYTGVPSIYDGTAQTTSLATRASGVSGRALNIHKSMRHQVFHK